MNLDEIFAELEVILDTEYGFQVKSIVPEKYQRIGLPYAKVYRAYHLMFNLIWVNKQTRIARICDELVVFRRQAQGWLVEEATQAWSFTSSVSPKGVLQILSMSTIINGQVNLDLVRDYL